MRVSYDIEEGLKMIQDRYYFGMFLGDDYLGSENEADEYKMRDALNGIISYINEHRESLFLEGGCGGNHNPHKTPPAPPKGGK